MGTAAPQGILRIPGRLCIGPTSVATAFPHGGTALGSVKTMALMYQRGEFPLRSRALGIIKDVLYTGEQWRFACALRTWDDDALDAVFPFTTQGATSLRELVKQHHTSHRAGQLGSAVAVALLFSADDPLNQPSCYMPRAIPMFERQIRLALDLSEEHVVPVVFLAIPPASGAGGNAIQYGLLEDITI